MAEILTETPKFTLWLQRREVSLFQRELWGTFLLVIIYLHIIGISRFPLDIRKWSDALHQLYNIAFVYT